MQVNSDESLQLFKNNTMMENNTMTCSYKNSFQERLNSFSQWPVWAKASPFYLALSGFYYIGRGDEVRCAFCKVEIMNWREGDDPIVDHNRWAPQCKFAQNVCSSNVIYKTIEQQQQDDATAADDVTASIYDSQDVCGTGAMTMRKPKHGSYTNYKDRLATFTDWPRDIYQRPHDLASAGFFYTGRNAEVRCFQSDCGLSDWEPTDEPWREHARWFPRCEYVIAVKGKEYVQDSVSMACVIKETLPSTSSTSSLSPPLLENDQDDALCKICFDRRRNMCFVPCGHVIACEKCSCSIEKCPLCRSKFSHAQKLYFV
ncbi:Inhibitor of apoptosis 3 iap-3 [Spodoptera exigua multiple nucleopolyhedrovirus]|nr:Inhibitor of apoptosis 3 iap-3 [Spodoptera exigua multiple nucleopolyhedrovirus]